MDSLEAAAGHARIESELAPLDRSASRRLGMLYFYLDSLDAADSVFTSLVESGEHNIANHQYLARIALHRDDPQEAIEQYTLVTKMADSSWDNWFNLGLAYRAAEDHEREIDAYLKGLDRTSDPRARVQLLFSLGAAYDLNGQHDKSIATFEQLLEIMPNYDPALNYLGYTLADRGERLDYARDLLEQAVEIAPRNPAYLDSYGWVYYRLGEYQKARKYLEQAVELDTDPVMFDHLGDTYYALGNREEARRWWQKALELDPENESIRLKLEEQQP
jgi:tetratricopeptide (TPR) repeat protein